MFSVQQLLLDLNSAPVYMADQPDIDSIFASDPLMTDYINQYWDALRAGDAIVFSQAVQAEDSSPIAAEPTLVPNDLDFIVTAYTDDSADGDLTDVQKQGLWTLNYLVMAAPNNLPPTIVAPNWNWLSAAQDGQYDGVMAVRRGEFVNYLKDVIDSSLGDIAIQPTMDMQMDGLEVDYTWGHQKPNPEPAFSIKNNSGDPTHVLSSSYKSDTSEDSDNPGYDKEAIIGDTLVWSSENSDVFFSKNTIKIVTTACAFIDVGLFGLGIFGNDMSHTKGYVYATTNTTVFTMTANTDGSLHVAKESTNEDLRQSSDSGAAYYDGDLNASFFAQVATLGDMQDMVDKMSKYYSDLMSDYMDDYTSDILNLLNNTNAWVFPGADTYQYAGIGFSNFQDLVSLVSYGDIS